MKLKKKTTVKTRTLIINNIISLKGMSTLSRSFLISTPPKQNNDELKKRHLKNFKVQGKNYNKILDTHNASTARFGCSQKNCLKPPRCIISR